MLGLMRMAALACLLVACGGGSPMDGGAPDAGVARDAGRFPAAVDLPEREEPPDPFVTYGTGEAVETAEAWNDVRAPELRELFAHYVYGFAPPAPASVTATPVASATIATPSGDVLYEEVELSFGVPATIRLAVFRPPDATAAPVLLALNKCGNQSVIDAPEVPLTTRWTDPSCSDGGALVRGVRASSWPIEAIVARGFALATFHESDAAPDDASAGFAEGLHPHFDLRGETAWGAIAAWSWALSRAVDHLETAPGVDPSRIVTVGHSRRGKAALWAAALDPRIAMSVPHQSGTAGATLSRSDLGESVQIINAAFPHWFDDVFPQFANRETRLPIDQHLLLALVAPRPVLVMNGDDDTWADPPGARRAVELAEPVYALLGAPGAVVWRSRPGGHSLEASDWTIFMDFVERSAGP